MRMGRLDERAVKRLERRLISQHISGEGLCRYGVEIHDLRRGEFRCCDQPREPCAIVSRRVGDEPSAPAEWRVQQELILAERETAVDAR